MKRLFVLFIAIITILGYGKTILYAEPSSDGKELKANYQFRLASDKPVSGWTEMKSLDRDIILYVDPSTQISNSGIESIKAFLYYDTILIVNLVLNEEGKAKYLELESKNKGRCMTFFVNNILLRGFDLNEESAPISPFKMMLSVEAPKNKLINVLNEIEGKAEPRS